MVSEFASPTAKAMGHPTRKSKCDAAPLHVHTSFFEFRSTLYRVPLLLSSADGSFRGTHSLLESSGTLADSGVTMH